MPHAKLVRDTDRSRRPPRRNETISLRYASGRMNSGWASMWRSSGSAYLDSLKNQLRSLSSHATGFLWTWQTQVSPSFCSWLSV